ncbi:unnamed protein product [Arctogadus glacialis]
MKGEECNKGGYTGAAYTCRRPTANSDGATVGAGGLGITHQDAGYSSMKTQLVSAIHLQEVELDDIVGGNDQADDKSNTNEDPTYTVEEAVETIGFGRFHVLLFVIMGSANIVEAMEIMLLAVVSPEIRCEWRLEDWQVALVSTMVFLGFMLCGALSGYVADRYGRWKVVVAGFFWSAYFSFLTSYAPSYGWFIFLRSLVGCGVAGVSQGFVLKTEFIPARHRSYLLPLATIFWMLGSMLIIVLGMTVVPTYGWRWMIRLSVTPSIVLLFLFWFIPESARYNVSAGNTRAAMETLEWIARMNHAAMPPGRLVESAQTERGSWRILLSPAFRRTTLLLWYTWFVASFSYYGSVLSSSELLEKNLLCITDADAEHRVKHRHEEGSVCYCIPFAFSDYQTLLISCLGEVARDDFDSLGESDAEANVRLGFSVAQREFGIAPLMTAEEMCSAEEPDSLSMVMYLSQFYQLLRETLPPGGSLSQSADFRSSLMAPASLLSRLGHSPSRKRIPREKKDALWKRRRTSRPCLDELEHDDTAGYHDDQGPEEGFVGGSGRSRVRLMANQLQARLDVDASSCQSPASSDAALRRLGQCLPSPPYGSEALDSPSLEEAVEDAAKFPGEAWRPKKRTQQQEQMSFRFKEKIKGHTPLPAVGKQNFVRMYTEGVSSMAEQITTQIQSQEPASPGATAVSAGGASGVCFFCSQRVYVMERLSAEGLFFHRSCFQCDHCRTTLRLSSYAWDAAGGRFYCLQHYDRRSGGPVLRKRAALSMSSVSHRTSIGSLQTTSSTDSLHPAAPGGPPLGDRRASVASLTEGAKRARGPPGERIELANYRPLAPSTNGLAAAAAAAAAVGAVAKGAEPVSGRKRAGGGEVCALTEEEAPEEVPEETLARYNLSLPPGARRSAGGSSSESEMDEGKEGERGASWRRLLELHAGTRGGGGDDEGDREDEDEEAEDGEEEEGEVDEEEENEGDYGSEPESSDEEESAPPAPKTHSTRGGCDITYTHTRDDPHPEPDSTTNTTTTTTRDLLIPGHIRSFASIGSSPLTLGSSHLSLTPTPTAAASTPERSSGLCSSLLSSSSSSNVTSSSGGSGVGGPPARGSSSSSGVGVDSGSSDTAVATPTAPPPLRGRGLDRPGPPLPVFPALALRCGGVRRDPDGSEVGVGGGVASEEAGSALCSSFAAASSLELLRQERGARAEREERGMREGGRGGEGADNGPPRAAGETTTTRRRRGGAGQGLAPLQGSSLFLHLKSLREAPPPAGGEGPRWAGRAGARALWKALFSGKERKKREGGGSVGGNMAAAARERKEGRSRQPTDYQLSGASGWPEESDVACSTVLQHCSLNPKTNLRAELSDLASNIQKVYPTVARSLGMGFCTSFSRIGGMIAPFIAQVLMSRSVIYAMCPFAVASIVCSLGNFLLPIETKGRALLQSS